MVSVILVSKRTGSKTHQRMLKNFAVNCHNQVWAFAKQWTTEKTSTDKLDPSSVNRQHPLAQKRTPKEFCRNPRIGS